MNIYSKLNLLFQDTYNFKGTFSVLLFRSHSERFFLIGGQVRQESMVKYKQIFYNPPTCSKHIAYHEYSCISRSELLEAKFSPKLNISTINVLF